MAGRYHLNVGYPNTAKEGLMSFESSTPFQAVNRGDFFDTTGWKIDDDIRGRVLEVVRVEHEVFTVRDDPDAYHAVRVYTKFAGKDGKRRDVIEDWEG